ncbi:MAG: tetratricopeptide repeat protein [Candidatus Omnitrophica bacterium]|nr:tetratricopeptide repeat protein [Candidatus Omnitrophota bacterium]
MKRLAAVIFSVLSICISINAFAQGQKASAQAMEKGLEAAGMKDWNSAISYFSEAYDAKPQDPAILYNLGLSNAKAGYELPAICWFRAYLSLSPEQPSNSEAVLREIAVLEASVEKKISKIIKEAINMVRDIPARNETDEKYGISRNWALITLVSLQAEAGDKQGALETRKLISLSNFCRGEIEERKLEYSRKLENQMIQDQGRALDNEIWFGYAKSLAWAGDIEAAKEAIGNMQPPGETDVIAPRMSLQERLDKNFWGYLIYCFIPPDESGCWEVDYELSRKAASQIQDKAERVRKEIKTNEKYESGYCRNISADIFADYARALSKDRYVTDPDNLLKEACENAIRGIVGQSFDPGEDRLSRVPYRVAQVGIGLYGRLQNIRRLTKSFSGNKLYNP